jgi:polar amino acid transport system substrate-binding protein
MNRSRTPIRAAAAGITILVAAFLTGCASTNDAASRRSVDAVRPPAPTPTTAAPTSDASNCTASLRPPNPLPAPLQMPAGSSMAAIQAQGALRVGVDQNTLFFGYRNPSNNQLEGFDIDVAREIARAIFGDPDKIQYTVVTTAQRLPAVAQNHVDLVASLVTMRCSRLQGKDAVLFSSQYYDAAQGLLVRGNSPDINGVGDLAGKRVCATNGSTSYGHLHELQPRAIMVGVDNRTECLAELQDGKVDAITADNTILYGFKKQDRTTRLLDAHLSEEPYGLAINQARPDLVRFVNGVLERMRADGTLAELEAKWLTGTVKPLPAVPAANYGD